MKGASTDADKIDPDSCTGAMMQGMDQTDVEADVPTDGTASNPCTSEGALMTGMDESGTSSADFDVVSNNKLDVTDSDEADPIQNDDESIISAHKIDTNECSPSSVRIIESSQHSPDSQAFMVETKCSDVSQNEIGSTSSEVKKSVSMNSDEKSYDDIRQIPSSNSDIIFDDVPSSPDTQAPFISDAASPSSAHCTAEGVLPIGATSDPSSVCGSPDVETVGTQIMLPSKSQTEDKFVPVAGVVNTVYDVDEDLDDAHIPDGCQPDDHSVDSDQTPRRILQMN